MKLHYQLSKLQTHRLRSLFILLFAFVCAMSFDTPLRNNKHPLQLPSAIAQQSGQGQPLQIDGDLIQYDSKTQVATARGNVQMLYKARGIRATAAQAQLFNRERRIVHSGDVYILQDGANSIRAEVVTYLIDEGRFVAQPKANQQVRSVYIVDDANLNNNNTTAAPSTPGFKRRN